MWMPSIRSKQGKHALQVWWLKHEVGARCLRKDPLEILAEETSRRWLGRAGVAASKESLTIGTNLGMRLQDKGIKEVYLDHLQARRPGINVGLFEHLADVVQGMSQEKVSVTIYTDDLNHSVHISDHSRLMLYLHQMRKEGAHVVGPMLHFPSLK
mmetsp:Transcript_18708/g.27059  ORF Transcript_18708/g.27059 Transcript_18708/m.27059 type:complete len:155 (-) Transcript_18708:62-526(-)